MSSHVEMIMLRDLFLQTKTGHNVKFKANQPVRVHAACVEDALAVGATLVDGSLLAPGELQQKIEVPLGFERERALFDACTQLAGKSSPDDFTAGNVPTLKAMQRILGYEVDRKEVNAAWRKVLSARSNLGE